jgi:hypothetical protein
MNTWATIKSAISELWAHINLHVTCSYQGDFPTNGIREIRVAWKNKQRRLLVPGITSCIQRSSAMGFQKAETDNTWSHYKEQHNVLHITAEAMIYYIISHYLTDEKISNITRSVHVHVCERSCAQKCRESSNERGRPNWPTWAKTNKPLQFTKYCTPTNALIVYHILVWSYLH